MATVKAEKTVEKDPNCIAVEVAFRSVFHPVNPRFFSGFASRYVGLSDRRDGVQWSAWHNHVDKVAELAVNLEGMEHDDWPIGRLVGRELSDPQLPAVAERVPLTDDVWVSLWRDAWAIYKVPTLDGTFLDEPARTLTRASWLAALERARQALGPDLRGRVVQRVTLPKKGPTDLEVSPHLHIRTSLWDVMPPTHEARVSRMEAGRRRLEALYEFVVERVRP